MYKPSQKDKITVRPSKREIPSAQELRVPGYGLPREMTDQDASKFRQKLLSSGQIKVGEPYDGFMSKEQTKALREKLISQDILRPGAGLAKLKASRDRRPPRPFAPRKLEDS